MTSKSTADAATGPASATDAAIAAAILALLDSRKPDATICPSDAARALSATRWRPLMPAVRDAARALAREGRVVVTQRGRALDPALEWHGPVRIGRAGKRVPEKKGSRGKPA